MRLLRRLATASIAAAIITGPPLLAAAWLQHHPARLPTPGQIQAWTQQPPTAGTIIGGCLILLGTAWLTLTLHLARTAVATLRRRHRRARHLPLPSPAQVTASSMAGVAALTMPAINATHTAAAVTESTQPVAPTADALDDSDPATSTPAGISLPGGGWIPYPTAIVITALSTAAWLYRRYHYRPDPQHPRSHDTDPDLQPQPDTIHTIATAVASHPPQGTASLPLKQLPHGVLRLTGPGAAPAARGLLVTAAIGTPHSVDITIELDDLNKIFPNVDAAELRKARTLFAARLSPTRDQQARADGDRAEQTAAPTSRGRPSNSDFTLLTLGAEPTATHRWHIDADGTTTGTGLTQPHRLCILDATAATDLLRLAADQIPQPTSAPLRSSTPHIGVPADADESTGTATAHLTLLGECRFTVAGQPVTIHRTAGLQILAYLAIHPDGATSTDLTRAVWPHLSPATIIQRLHTTLADLRKQLRPLLHDEPILRRAGRYQLNTQAITTDLHQWRTATRAMTQAIGTDAKQHACRQLLSLYRGELATGQDWTWLTPDREQTRRAAIDACSALAHSAQPTDAITWLQHAIKIDPYNAQLHQQAAQLLRAVGDLAGATELLEDLHARLDAS